MRTPAARPGEHGTAEPRRTRRVVLLALCVVLPAVLLLPLLLYGSSHYWYICDVCNSGKAVDRAWIGPDRENPVLLLSEGEEFRPSPTCTDFFGPDHVHRWTVQSYSDRGLGHGPVRHSPTAFLYEHNGVFRDLIKKKIAEGTLTKETFRALCELPRYPALLSGVPDEQKRLMALGDTLIREAGAGGHGPWKEAVAR